MDSDLNPDSSPVLPIELLIIRKGMQHLLIIICKRPKISFSTAFFTYCEQAFWWVFSGDLWV
jgi:hypothetical protein